jgi:WD40 repeat protein
MPFDPTKVKLTSTFKYAGTLHALCQEPDSGRLLAGGDDAAIHVFDPATKKADALARWTKHEGYVSALVALKQGGKSVIVSGSYDRRLIWWDANSGQPIRTKEAHQGWIRHVVPTPDGSRLVSVGDDMLVKVWDAADGKAIRTLAGHATRTPQGHVTALYALAVSPDGKQIASGDRHGEVRVWEADSGKLLSTFQVPTLYTYDPRQRKRSIGGIRTLAFSLDSNLLAAGGIGQIGNVDGLGGPIHVELWNWRKPEGRLVTGAKKQNGIVNQLLFHPDGDWLIGCGGAGGFFAFWKINPIPDTSKDKKGTVPDHHIKFDGHAHRIVLNVRKAELYAAGYHKLDVWTLGV